MSHLRHGTKELQRIYSLTLNNKRKVQFLYGIPKQCHQYSTHSASGWFSIHPFSYSRRRPDCTSYIFSSSNHRCKVDSISSSYPILLRHHSNIGLHHTISRNIHAASVNFDKSKVEDTLKAKLKKTEADKNLSSDKKPTATETTSSSVATPPKKPLWDRFVAELKHYYHGFRLLGLDIRIAWKTLWKILNGKPVVRRERNQFKRAVSDIFRLAPFSVFIIIPFAEFALPVVVSLFPRLLPSTFEDKTAREARLRKELSVKLQMAKFMQDTVEDIAMRSKKMSKENQATEDFATFFQKIRTTDEEPTNEEILKHAKLFEDELTLDSMTRPQLVALCRLIQVPAVGSNNLLRFLLQMKLNRLHADDTLIQREGIDNMTAQELQTACQARGMRALGVSEQRIKQQLQQWIDLHLNHDVPSSLLLLSRVLFMPENVPVETMVKQAISALPEKIADEAEVRAAELNCERIDNTKRYKVTKQEQLEIAKEEKEEKQKEKVRKDAEEQKKRREMEAEVVDEGPVLKDTLSELKDKAAIISEVLESEKKIADGPVLTDKAPVLLEEITREEIDALDKAIGLMAKEDSLNKTKSELEDLREDLVEYQQDVLKLDRNLSSEEDEILMKEKKASSRLQKKIAGFIGNMDEIVAELDQRENARNKTDDESEKQSISVNELKNSLQHLSEIPQEKLHSIAHLLDIDKDGEIDLSEVMTAFEALDSEDVSVTADQLHQIIGLIQSKKDEKKIKLSEEV
ncbi:mitochondrial proton/calcium exchanger protein-like isoform X2 [Styela clava]